MSWEMGGIEAKKLKSPGHFRYEFLDPFRPMIPKKYVLVDEALDYVGNSLCRPKYPKTPEHFSQCGNVPPSDSQEPEWNRHWRIRHPVYPDLYDPDGIRLRFSTRTTSGEELAAAPSPNVVAFRDVTWSKLSRFVRNKCVTPVYFVPGGVAWPMKAPNPKQLKAQRDLVQSTGCMWFEINPVSHHLVLVLFAYKQIQAAVDGELGQDLFETKSDDLPQADDQVVDQFILDILQFCLDMGPKKRISKPGMWHVVNTLISDSEILTADDPDSDAWEQRCIKATARSETLGRVFCKKGNRSIAKSTGINAAEVARDFLHSRPARVKARTREDE